MKERILITGSILMGLAVLIGAFGAHTLNDLLVKNGRIDTFETATKYLFYHSLGILFIGILCKENKKNKKMEISYYLMFLGVIIFSGSLYILSFTNITLFGAITPIGGVLFIISWLLLALSIKKQKHSKNNVLN